MKKRKHLFCTVNFLSTVKILLQQIVYHATLFLKFFTQLRAVEETEERFQWEMVSIKQTPSQTSLPVN